MERVGHSTQAVWTVLMYELHFNNHLCPRVTLQMSHFPHLYITEAGQSFAVIRTSNIMQDSLSELLLTSPHAAVAVFRCTSGSASICSSLLLQESPQAGRWWGLSAPAQPDIRVQGRGSLCATPALPEHCLSISSESKYQLLTSIKNKSAFLAVSVFHFFHLSLQTCV